MSNTLKIGTKLVSRLSPAFIIAEVGQAHDGSIGIAHSFIDAAADAGVDAVKFQTHFAEAESTLDEQWRVRFSYEDITRYEYWKRISFTADQWAQLSSHAKSRGLIFLSTAFSHQAFELLEKLNMPAWKVASGEVLSNFLLDRFIESGKPLLISSGMSGWNELINLAQKLKERNAEYCFFQCTSKYPTTIKDVGINVLNEMRQVLGPIVGLSDHSGNLNVLKTAIARGANMIEAHITFDKKMFGPDSGSSLTCAEFAELVNFRDTVHALDSHPVNKDDTAAELNGMRQLFMRSVALKEDAKAGTVLTLDMLTLKKPASGIPESKLLSIVGKRLTRDVSSLRLLNEGDFVDD